jgi:hypothetical protein
MIDADTLERIAQSAQAQGPSESTVQALRAAWPALHFSYCMDDDVCGVAPVRELDGINLYLVDGRNHCPAFTESPAAATGVVLAEIAAGAD